MSRSIRVRRERESGKEDSDILPILNSLPVKLFFLITSIFILYSVYNSIKITVQKVGIHRQAEREVEELRLQNLHLSLGMKEMSTDRYLEKEARDRLNFGDNEEIVFVIPPNTLEEAKGEVEKIVKESESYSIGRKFTLLEWVEFLSRGI
ncbi:MAG: septum formation initiator family protein [Candidatus Dojkabacteria bacterium]